MRIGAALDVRASGNAFVSTIGGLDFNVSFRYDPRDDADLWIV